MSFKMIIYSIKTQECRSLRTRTFETWFPYPIHSFLFSIINHVTHIQDLPHLFTSKLLDIFFNLSSAFNLLIFHINLYALQAPLLFHASCGFTSKTFSEQPPQSASTRSLSLLLLVWRGGVTARRGGMKNNARLMAVQSPTELKNEKTAFQKGTVKVGQHTQAIERHNRQE